MERKRKCTRKRAKSFNTRHAMFNISEKEAEENKSRDKLSEAVNEYEGRELACYRSWGCNVFVAQTLAIQVGSM